ncbi:MAG: substrate-binding periplasmic protein [Anaerolineae bacterium]
MSRFTILVLLLVGCGGNGRTWQSIQQTGVIRVGLDPTYPPFETLTDAGYAGIDIELAQAIAADWGVTVEFVPLSYDGLYDALGTGQVDLLISALVLEPDKTRDFAYSEPYFNAGEVLVVPKDSPVREMADLNTHILAVELGARGHVEATVWARRLPDLVILTFDTPDEALTAVAQGQADAAVVDGISGRLFLKTNPGLRIAEEPVTVEPYAIVARTDDVVLLENVNGSLERLVRNGRLDQIVSNWLAN